MLNKTTCPPHQLASRELPISREHAEAVGRGQAKYFSLMARHNNLAERASDILT